MRKLSLALTATLGLMTHPLAAQSSSDKATAEALFANGRRLMASGDYAAACPKFAASQKLDPGVGTLLNLADCYEKKGQTASAWGEFLEAASAARAIGSKEREQAARDRAQSLEKRLSRLTVTIAPGNAPNLRVARDGEAVDPAALGTPLPIDPGKHLIEVTAPGRKPWSQSVDVKGGPEQLTIAIPVLASAGSPAGDTLSSTPAQPKVSVAEGSTTASNSGSPGATQRAVALGVGAVGVVGVALGGVFGLKAKNGWSEAQDGCPTHLGCSSGDVEKGNDARSAANLSTIAFIVGGAGLAGGVVLWMTAPKTDEHGQTASANNLAIHVGPSSVSLTGAF